MISTIMITNSNHTLLLNHFGIECKPAMVMNPQENAILVHLHGLTGKMVHTAGLVVNNDFDPMNIEQLIIDSAKAVCSAHHSILGFSIEVAVYQQGMLFNLPYLADQKTIV